MPKKSSSGSSGRAAPSVGSVPPERDRVRWLLDFIGRDISTLRPGELLDLRNETLSNLHTGGGRVASFDADELRVLHSAMSEGRSARRAIVAARNYLNAVQAPLRAGLSKLNRHAVWRPFALDAPAPQWMLVWRTDGTIGRSYEGAPQTVMLASAVDLLVRWWSEFRRCARDGCGAWFLPKHGRQRYHDPHCSWETRYAKFKPKRNYKNEYARRFDSTRTDKRKKQGRK